jgi:hypothetical protein
VFRPLALLFNVLAVPTDTFLRLRDDPRWVGPALVLLSVVVLCALARLPLELRISRAHMSASLPPSVAERVVITDQSTQWVAALIAPIPLVVRWAFFSLIVFLACAIGGSTEIRMQGIVAVTVVTESILTFMAVINVLLLYALESVGAKVPLDLIAVPGLDLLLADKEAHLPLAAFLKNIHPFSAWYVAVAAIGVSVMTGHSKARTVLIMALAWLFNAGFQGGVVAVLQAYMTGAGS